jgi:two-component system, OmpR family, response regulator
MHLLVVEDDPALAGLLNRLLRSDRHVVEVAASGESALDVVDAQPSLDAVILDVVLPGISGIEVARRVRRKGSTVPIVMLTARDTVDDRVLGLDAGADDYLVKPFAYEELAARLRSVARRGANHRSAGPVLRAGPIALDDRQRRVTVSGTEVELTGREFAVLECLLRHRGQVLSREQLLDHAWPLAAAVTLNSVDAYVHYLRTKLGPAGKQIRTVRGIGYRLTDG